LFEAYSDVLEKAGRTEEAQKWRGQIKVAEVALGIDEDSAEPEILDLIEDDDEASEGENAQFIAGEPDDDAAAADRDEPSKYGDGPEDNGSSDDSEDEDDEFDILDDEEDESEESDEDDEEDAEENDEDPESTEK